MGQIFINQTKLRIRLILGVDVTGASTIHIQYRKPDGVTGAWDASIESATDGIMYYDIQSGDLDEAGIWTFWGYIVFASRGMARGEPVLVTVYETETTTSTSTTTTTTTTTTAPDYATWNPDDKYTTVVLSNENLTAVSGRYSGAAAVRSTVGVNTGKHYWEITSDVQGGGICIGVGTPDAALDQYVGKDVYGYGYYGYSSGSATYHDATWDWGWGSSYGPGNIIGIALDMDAGKLWWSLNGVWQESGDPATGANPAFTGLSGIFHGMWHGYKTTEQVTANFGASPFAYSVPNGFNSGLYD